MSEKQIKRYTVGEEVFNSVTHGVGALLSVAGTIVLIVLSVMYGNAVGLGSSIVYGASLIILYTMSTLYHAISSEKAKSVLRVFDHTSIFILIAGSYTPYCLIALGGETKALIVVIVVWACAILGIVLNAISLEKTEKLGLVLYVAMGWAIIVIFKDVLAALPTMAFWLLLLGGVCYTGGIVFYKMKNTKYMHSIWHLFVLGGSVLHYISIVMYVLPMTY
ncbi:MAG: hemolysin III family protein [Anaerovoracaceae bacterium]